MKFELEPYHHGITKEQVLQDIRRVAKELGKNTLTQQDYKHHGTFSPDLARDRCGSWFAALTEAGLGHSRNLNIPKDECLADLKRVANKLGKSSVTTEEYKENGKFSPAPLVRHFGSWFAALDAAGLERTRTLHVTDEDYFVNLQKMWVSLGRQPHYTEVQKPFSNYCAGAYEHRFGSWRKALEAFIAYVNQDKTEDTQTGQVRQQPNVPSEPLPAKTNKHDSRKAPGRISWRLRFLVMRRDNFKCRICGRSPATYPGLVLHVDHVEARSKGGPTIMDNLQTLCEQDNIGKSNLSMKEDEEG
jgi:5-methylcytosine-specific restriction endonuclease McrA